MIFLSMPRNLILAYAITWLIHLCYLAFLGVKSRRLRKEEVQLDSAAPSATGEKQVSLRNRGA